MPQHIVVNITKSYLPGCSLEAFYIMLDADICVWD